MNIRQFEYILAVAEIRHFELAAEKCFATQSTLSTMVSKFEEELGITIFNRKKKPVEITAEGEVIIEQLKAIQSQIGVLNELAKEFKGEVNGNLTISVIPTVAPPLLPLFLQSFAEKFPQLHIEIREQTTAEITRLLKSRELDIGILSVPINDPDLIEIPLYNEPFQLLDYREKYTNSLSVEALDPADIWLMEEGHCMRTQILKFCDLDKNYCNTHLNFNFKAGSIDSLLRFVRANQATTLVPYLAALSLSESDQSYLRNFQNPVPVRSIGLVVHRHFVKRRVLYFLEQEINKQVHPLLPIITQTKALNPL
ncbi:LysR substrate-binding domain-containing protein [Flavobacterium sp. N1719]|uniref:LysR substrate-binding domain-containing protein n=1 Tax=Flavobacterium sp. N1719 TaxID=2885633 RepID=UPI002221D9EF|nr:LysR substrate-binding domain-containing protein [Flavobacterium sp. N1719]